MLLLTWHGTVVGLREGGGGLQQMAPGQAVPGTVPLDLDLPAPGQAPQRVRTALGPLMVAAGPGGRGVTLARYGQFLCAELTSQELTFSRHEASSYEAFLPVTDRHLADLITILGHSWTDQLTGRLIARRAIRLAPGFRLVLDHREVDLTAWFEAVPESPVNSPYEPPRAIKLAFGGESLELVIADQDGHEAMQAPLPPALAASEPDSLSLGADVQAEIASWAMAELSFWRLRSVSVSRCEEVWATLNRTNPSVFLFHFRGGAVTLIDKSTVLSEAPSYLDRAHAYLRFFGSVAPYLAPDLDFKIALGVADRLPLKTDVPLFCFQKTRGARTILLPDIDLLVSDFHAGGNFLDRLDFSEKTPRAIFVGATTGGELTLEAALACSLPRLRAARFFQGHKRVDFFLPAIVQYRSQEVLQTLEQMPFCQQPRMSWQEQLTRRFLISMDGNGATCSRVAISLRSNSVLVKYASNEILYYFHGLQEWLHYIPIEQDADMDALLDLDVWRPGSAQRIARAGTVFAERFLTRDAGIAYTVTLLSLYAECFGEQTLEPRAIVRAEAPEPPSTRIGLVAHIQNTGDCVSDRDGWAGVPGFSRPIEGFQISNPHLAPFAGVQCQGVLADGSLTTPLSARLFCGTRGKGAPLHGFVLRSALPAKTVQTVVYEGRFEDGSHVGPLQIGALCRSPSNAPLTGLRIRVAGAAVEQAREEV